MVKPGGFYAVHRGRGGQQVYSTWADCEAAVKGFPQARYKKFKTADEARSFASDGGAAAGASTVTKAKKPAKAAAAPAGEDYEYSPHDPSAARHLPNALSAHEKAPDFTIWFDGGARGNPGIAGAGAILQDSKGKCVWEGVKFVGKNSTNNQAEYSGLIEGLRAASTQGARRLLAVGDSKLVIKQMEVRACLVACHVQRCACIQARSYWQVAAPPLPRLFF
jgi:Caulimovirus viroplasmin/Reverse transcriptase-like